MFIILITNIILLAYFKNYDNKIFLKNYTLIVIIVLFNNKI